LNQFILIENYKIYDLNFSDFRNNPDVLEFKPIFIWYQKMIVKTVPSFFGACLKNLFKKRKCSSEAKFLWQQLVE